MKNSLILNFDLLNELNISISEFLFISYIYFEKKIDIPFNDIDINKLQKENYIKLIQEKDEEIIILRHKSVELIENLFVEAEISFDNDKKKVLKSNRTINNELESRTEEYRNKWKGLKPGSMGSLKACKQKLNRWMKENPDYSFDDILKAVDIYLNSGVLKDLRFLKQADNFIFKQNANKEEESFLSAFIEEIHSYTEDGWTTNLN